jgi:hypothetical protein
VAFSPQANYRLSDRHLLAKLLLLILILILRLLLVLLLLPLLLHLQIVPRSRRRGFIHPLPQAPSCCSAELVKHNDNFILYYYYCYFTATQLTVFRVVLSSTVSWTTDRSIDRVIYIYIYI